MSEEEMHEMLKGAVKDYSRLYRQDDKGKMAEAIAVHCALYGGDRTCWLMCHYGENLTSKIRELL
jgi:hypothetical protein